MKSSFDSLSLDLDALVALFRERYGKGRHHAEALYTALQTTGSAEVATRPEYRASLALAARVASDFAVRLPVPETIQEDGENIKFTLRFNDGTLCESVILAMKTYQSLCVSSQSGCRYACEFCETGRLGYLRDLAAEEILVQVVVAQTYFGRRIRNVVFMGMGEALDNDKNVLKAIDIMSHPKGLSIPTSRISISTVGNVENIRKLNDLYRLDLERMDRQREAKGSDPTAYRNIRLAVSLNAPNDAIRDKIMPVNRVWPMATLKRALQEVILRRKWHDLFIEYVLIPGVNDDADALAEYLADLPCTVNLIPYNRGPGAPADWMEPSEEQARAFFDKLAQKGQVVRRRHGKGRGIMAACGQLGGCGVRQ